MLLDAAIDILMESGLSACALSAVAKRAGLTTGAVQHHFTSKAHLMRAVISERLFGRAEALALEDIAHLSVEERCALLVRHQWKNYGDPKYIAIWDIILGARDDQTIRAEITDWQKAGTKAHEQAIAAIFADKALPKAKVRAIQYFMNAHLRGLALLRTVDQKRSIIKAQLDLLIRSLVVMVSDETA